MSLTNEEVAHVAKLARIRLEADEVAHYAGEINAILGWIEQLQEVNTDDIAPLTSVSHETLPWRDDVVADGNKQDDILKNAKGAQYGCFAVPKVIE